MKRINQLNILRFIAAIVIVVFHFAEDVFPFDREPFIRILRGDAYIVSFFFVLSGFIIAYVYYPQAREGIRYKEFLIKRLSRFLPLYWVTLAIMIAFFYQSSTRPIFVAMLEIPLLHAWVPSALFGFNFVDWAISVFFAIYLIFPPLYHWFLSIGIKRSARLIVALWIFSQLAIHLLDLVMTEGGIPWAGDFLRFNPVFHLNTFLLGVLGGWQFHLSGVREQANQWKNAIQLVVAVVLVVLFASFRYELQNATPIRLAYSTGLLAPLYLWIIIGLARDRTRLSDLVSSKTLVMLGDLSFSIYLLQSPVFEFYEQFLRLRLDFYFSWVTPLHFYLYLGILLLVAYFSRYWFEVPAQRWIRKRFLD